MIPSHPKDFPQRFFTTSLPVSISKKCLANTIHLRYGVMLFIMCHFYVKAIVSIELVKTISFSILFTFRIFAMRLCKFMNFFSLTFCICNLNISKMWLIKTLLFFRMKSLFAESRMPKMTVCGGKVGKLKIFWKHSTKSDHKHLNGHIQKMKYAKRCFVVEITERTQWRWLYFKSMKFFIKVAETVMRHFARSALCRSLVHKKHFSFIWEVTFMIEYLFCP